MSRDHRKLRVFTLADRLVAELACRLGFLEASDGSKLAADYTELAAGLGALIRSLSPKP
jgi:hypothetical protein